jgi:RNA polymerase sigma factor (sigma-70 family)
MGTSEAAKDVLQDSLILVFRFIHQYQNSGSFEGWMKKIVVNTALKALDKSWVKRAGSVADFYDEPSADPTIIDLLHVTDLMNLVASLPDGYREVFCLAAIDEYSHQEIASMLHIPENTSRTKLRRARHMLQTMILQLEKIQQ